MTMINTIEMQDMRYLNMFGRTTKISTRHFFSYNMTMFFCVPKRLVSKAIGPNGKNAKKLTEIFNKKVKIIPLPESISDAETFIHSIIEPVSFKSITIDEKEIIITAGSQNKAALLGRNKRRLIELQKISKTYLRRELKII
jgi:hypothetical protein